MSGLAGSNRGACDHRGVNFREDYLPALRACLQDADDWYTVERCFQPSVPNEEIDDGRPVVYAFGYMLVEPSREEVRDRAGVFAPRIEWDDAAFPEPLEDIRDEMLEVWSAYADALHESPVARSRLHDLLWVRRHSDAPFRHAQMAADAYLELASNWKGLRLVECLSRALEIGVETNDEKRIAAAVELVIAEVEAELANDDWRPGIPLRLLERLVSLRPARRPEALPDLLRLTGDRYSADPHIAEAVSQLQAALAPPEERTQLARDQVERWRSEASKATGLVRYAWLQQALGIARSNGLADLADAVLQEIQEISVDDLDLKPVSAEISIPREEVDAEIERIAAASSTWEEALTLFGIDGPPSGQVEANEQLVAELAEKHPLTVLIPKQVLGAYGSLIFEAKEPDEHQRVELADAEARRIRFWALFATDQIAAIVAKFGIPERSALENFLTTGAIDAELGARLADGVLRYLDGDEEAALHILVPQLEAAIRGLAAGAGITVIKNPKGPTPGGVVPLGGVLAALKGRMDESWRRYLSNALADPLGVNLRNAVAHGLHGPATQGDVVIAIHIACHLRLLSTGQKGSAE